ncbi:hypothetical protein [Streptomyces sp. NBC_01618]|uniref:hypothetical protein n=1 Tax=Streptomyces sp. NBC_01618 TaxID=2975900 RepID=UPI003864A65F|nr:hypothetical protein OH735_08555 [Streptomyces sp. NBC_01618]
MTDRITRIARLGRVFRTVADAVRSVVAPAALVRNTDLAVPDPADVFTDEEMPAPEAIEEAAAEYAAAADQARAADRAKRKAKKLLGRLPAGIYGRWQVERVQSSRTTADLDSIRATYARLGLGPVPMRPCAPSLRITELAAVEQLPAPAAADLPALVAA